MLPTPMTENAATRRQMRILAVVLTGLWAVTAVAVASAYRPGGPVDIVVMLACFLPVFVSTAGIAWPPVAGSHRHRVALVWIWIAAVLFAVPVLYGVASALVAEGAQSLVPSVEAAYAGVLALFAMAVFSVVEFVHLRRAAVVFERRATLLTVGLGVLLTAAIGVAFGLVAVLNDQALRDQEPLTSRYGPTDPDLEPPFCDEPVELGRNAEISIAAKSSLDNQDRGRAVLTGQRGGDDEIWGGSWEGPDGAGQAAYLRIGRQAWANDSTDDPHAPGTTWRQTVPDPFSLAGGRRLTMDGPPHSVVDVPRGSIVAEDLGLEIVEGARARHCRTFIDGPTALSTFLPLRWLLLDSHEQTDTDARRWRGELDWWVFGDGELGRARVEVSGAGVETDWATEGVRAVLEAELEAVHRDRDVDVAAPATSVTTTTSPRGNPAASAESGAAPPAPPGSPPAAALESAAP